MKWSDLDLCCTEYDVTRDGQNVSFWIHHNNTQALEIYILFWDPVIYLGFVIKYNFLHFFVVSMTSSRQWCHINSHSYIRLPDWNPRMLLVD